MAEPNPVCPHCDNEETEWWEVPKLQTEDGSRSEIECGACGKSYFVSVTHIILFSSAKDEDNL